MKNKSFYGLSNDDMNLILNNCFANIFVTDGEGNIIFVNEDSAKSLCKSVEYLIHMNCRDLLSEGITDYSTTLETIRTGTRTMGTFTNIDGNEVMAVTTPIFNGDGSLKMCVTYSRLENDMSVFLEALEKERQKGQNYKALAGYFSSSAGRRNELVFRSKQMERVRNVARAVARTDATIMVYGESGTGKEVLANYIHSNSLRKEEIFIPINCAAIPSELLESEFFGYEKGSFTGANTKGKAGLFEIAQNGTLFLDEIGELSLSMQSKLLRCLETGEFRRIGGDKVLHANVRIIGATNRDLKAMTKTNEFREDLYYRLNVLPIQIPPLRERRDDISELVEYFLDKMNQKHDRHITVEKDLMDILESYDWPGNIRELKNIIERYVVTRDSFTIEALKSNSMTAVSGRDEEGNDRTGESAFEREEDVIPLKAMISRVEREYIEKVLKGQGGDKQKAARLLGISRAQFYRKIKDE